MENNNGKESFYRDTMEEIGSESYPLEDPMAFWEKEKNTIWKKIGGRSETPFVLMGIGLVFILVIFFIVYPGGVGDDSSEKGVLEDRLHRMEAKIDALMLKADGFSQVRQDTESLKKSVLRFDAADASETLRMDRMAEDLVSIKREMEKIKKEISSQTKPVVSSSPAGKTETANRSVTYKVQKGDTLFSISRRYGVSIEAIRKLNNLSTNAIQPGQELKVKE